MFDEQPAKGAERYLTALRFVVEKDDVAIAASRPRRVVADSYVYRKIQ